MRYEPTVRLPAGLKAEARRSSYELTTYVRRDGRTGFMLTDKLTGRVKGRSRSLTKIHAHLKRGLRGGRT